jgi:hypothetical protein
MLKTKSVEITGNGKTINYYLNKGIDIKCGERLIIDINDLIPTSAIKIECYCDICNSDNVVKYFNYNGNIQRNGIYRCNECAKSVRSEKIKTIFLDEKLKSDILEKTKKTNIERFGFYSPMQSEEIKTKTINTNFNKYGFSNPMKNKDIKIKLKKSILEKYGVESFAQTEIFKIKFKATCNKKYGCDNVFQNEEIKYKIKQTLIEKYGVDNPTKNPEIFTKSQKNSYKIIKHNDIDISYQGTYELDFINFCIKNEIKFEKGPTIDYTLNGVERKYHSDFYIPDINLICEVKSIWTYNKDLEENLAKSLFSEKSGYLFLFVIDKNYEKLKEYLNI